MSALQYEVPAFDDLKKLVETSFGFTPCTWQLDSALSQLQKKDVFTISPTGSGKTLTFWIPMLCNDGGVTIIITPLNILGDKNETEVHAMGISAVNLTATTATDEVFKVSFH
jgi:superfamily II DNA helicase RecQ